MHLAILFLLMISEMGLLILYVINIFPINLSEKNNVLLYIYIAIDILSVVVILLVNLNIKADINLF